MTLTPEQKQAVTDWVAGGDNISAIQKKLAENFRISLTYMDVRFLVDDLGLEMKNAAPKADVPDVSRPSPAGPAPGPGTPQGKKGFLDKMKEKVGLGKDDEAEEPADAAMADGELPNEFADDLAEPAPAGAGSVTVDLDRIVRPGSVASGSVTFSDGTAAKWGLDQYGRLMLDAGKKGYQPSAADVQAFQHELQKQLQRQGY